MEIRWLVLLLSTAALPMAAQAQNIVPGEAATVDDASAQSDRANQRAIEQPVTNLAEAIAATYWNNPTLLAQRATLRSTDNRYPIARAAFGPSLGIEASHSYQRDWQEIQPNLVINQGGWATTAAAILTQPLYSSGRNRAAVNQALAEIAFGRDSLKLIEIQVLLSSVTAYIELQRDTALVAIARENLELLQRQYVDNQERFRVREITATDLQQIETRVELARAQLTGAQGQVGVSRSRFVQTIGAIPGELQSPTALHVEVVTLEDALAYGELNSPVYRAAQSREKISRAALDAAKAQYGPQIDLRGTASLGSVSPYSNNLRTEQVRGEIVLRQQLIDSGLRDAQIRNIREANDADWRLIDGAMRDTRQAIAGSWETLAASRASLANYSAAENAARIAYIGAAEQEKAGARTTLDVLDLARDLLTVRTNYVTVLANEYLSRANLLAAMGRLTPELIVPDLETYDPSDHFREVSKKGDIPLLTTVLSELDGVTTSNSPNDRSNRDVAGQLSAPAAVPMMRESATLPLVSDGTPVIEPAIRQ